MEISSDAAGVPATMEAWHDEGQTVSVHAVILDLNRFEVEKGDVSACLIWSESKSELRCQSDLGGAGQHVLPARHPPTPPLLGAVHRFPPVRFSTERVSRTENPRIAQTALAPPFRLREGQCSARRS